jgi:autophagy-related protein 11
MLNSAQTRLDEIRIVSSAVQVAVSNLMRHVSSLQQKHTDAQEWVRDVVLEQTPVVEGCKEAVAQLSKISVRRDVLQSKLLAAILPQAEEYQRRTNHSSSATPLLRDLVDESALERATSRAHEILQQLKYNESQLHDPVQKIDASSGDLVAKVKEQDSEPDSQLQDSMERLMEDIETMAETVSSDSEHVSMLVPSSKALSLVSKRALVHTQELLPALSEAATKLARLYRQLCERRNAAGRSAARRLQAVSAIEAALAGVNQQLAALEIDAEGMASFDMLGALARLPYIYGSVLIESVRRREWDVDVKQYSSALAEGLAVLRDEEERRRKKWRRSLADAVRTGDLLERAVAVEVSLRGDDQHWPLVERRDIDDYIAVLRTLQGMESIARDLTRIRGELERPAAQPGKRVQAFKRDSVHGALLGRSAMLLPADNEVIRSLRDEKSKLEEKLKSSESRVRKLEDIVHRQSDMSRHASGNTFQAPNSYKAEARTSTPPIGPPFSPLPRVEAPSRRSSVSSRRFSVTQGAEEKALAQRIVALEAELAAEREQGAQRASGAQKEAEAMATRIDEAESTNKDLMGNLDAQKREFDDERRLLEENARSLEARLEEVVGELDRLVGSRERERAESDDKARVLEEELRKVEEDNGNLRLELRVERANAQQLLERAVHAEERLRGTSSDYEMLEKTVQRLQDQIRERTEDEAEQQKSLIAAHRLLLPNQPAPAEFGRLVDAIQLLAERTSSHLRDVEDALATTRADNEALQNSINQLEATSSAMREKYDVELEKVFELREALAGEKEKASLLEAEVAQGRYDVNELRAKLAEGETGTESMKERMAQEEAKNIGLSAELAAMQAEITMYEQELRNRQDRINGINKASEALAAHLRRRTDRAKDISHRLYSFSDRINRLMETLGFLISYQDGAMIIQRAPKTMTASGTIATDAAAAATAPPQDRSLSSSPKWTRRLGDSIEHLHVLWAEADDAEDEGRRYAAFIDAVGRMDMDAVCEAITKRVKDVEHVARKWQKEARSYRDRAHRFQSDAHDKIAFRAFKEGDLALFLPTRNQATRPWAAFNVGAPHYFLREQDAHKLRAREWLLARITRVEERVVDLSRAMQQRPRSSVPRDAQSVGGGGASSHDDDGGSASFVDDENPFELSDGLRWYLLDAAEEKPGAPSTPGLAKSTVASANVDAKGSVRVKKTGGFGGFGGGGATSTLSKSLDSRRSSSNSKKDGQGQGQGQGQQAAGGGGGGSDVQSPRPSSSSTTAAADVNAATAATGSSHFPTLAQQPVQGSFLPARSNNQLATAAAAAAVVDNNPRELAVKASEFGGGHPSAAGASYHHHHHHHHDQNHDNNHELQQEVRRHLWGS